MPKRRISLLLGNLAEIGGLLLGICFIAVAPGIAGVPLKFLLYLVAWVCFLFFPHGLAHYLVGIIVGVKFRYYTLSKSSISKLKLPILPSLASKLVVLTLKVDRRSFHLVSRGRRGAMFASGALASMILPFISASTSLGHLPFFLSELLLAFSVLNFLFDLYYSPRAGDISRARNALQP